MTIQIVIVNQDSDESRAIKVMRGRSIADEHVGTIDAGKHLTVNLWDGADLTLKEIACLPTVCPPENHRPPITIFTGDPDGRD